MTYRPPISNAGEPIGDNVTLKNSCPSVGRCGLGCVTSHETQA